jgi:DNA-binding HxlR family transcriptional regulator
MKSSLPIEKCDVAYAMNIIGGKWKIYILWKLYHQRIRFAELRRLVPGISEAVLIAQLKMLENDGLVRRITYNEIPPHVEYELTTQAELLGEALDAVRVWGGLHRKAVLQKPLSSTCT